MSDTTKLAGLNMTLYSIRSHEVGILFQVQEYVHEIKMSPILGSFTFNFHSDTKFQRDFRF